MSGFWDDSAAPIIPVETVEKIPVFGVGVHFHIPFEHYLAQDRASKTTLWTLYDRSPAHARVVKEQTNAMQNGQVIHCAVLEPDEFRSRFVRGAENRRGKRWLELVEEHGEGALTYEQYDNALALRDAVKDHPYIKKLTGPSAYREVSAFAVDPITGLPTKARLDGYLPGDGVGNDLKISADARYDWFIKQVRTLGYHMGEAHYTKVWRDAGADLKAFVHIVVEPEPPYAVKIYDLDPDTIAEGEAIRAKAMERWAHCVETGVWPGYDEKPVVETIGLRKYDYKETVPLSDGVANG